MHLARTALRITAAAAACVAAQAHAAGGHTAPGHTHGEEVLWPAEGQGGQTTHSHGSFGRHSHGPEGGLLREAAPERPAQAAGTERREPMAEPPPATGALLRDGAPEEEAGPAGQTAAATSGEDAPGGAGAEPPAAPGQLLRRSTPEASADASAEASAEAEPAPGINRGSGEVPGTARMLEARRRHCAHLSIPERRTAERPEGGDGPPAVSKVWCAHEGETLGETLERWVGEENATRRIDRITLRRNAATLTHEWEIGADSIYAGSLEEVVADLVNAFSEVRPQPYAEYWRDNHVLEIKTRGTAEQGIQ